MDSYIYLTAVVFDFIGKFLLALLVILVHNRVRKEGKIDKKVLKEMRLEKVIGSVSLILLVLGFAFHLADYFLG
ncbi:hypothetical protein HYV50_01445 [Candidatus Pacearchaeota archaeon]|nr:hypothetical protein [Candidatus Pacearchaeota archaeon]